MSKAHILLAMFLLLFGGNAFSQKLVEAATKNDTISGLALIKGGADVNETDGNGTTALFTACRWNSVAMVKLLLANGATVDKPRTKTGRTALLVGSAYYAGVPVIKMLVDKGADVNAKADNGATALMLAAQNSKADVVEYLLAHGADAAAKDNKDQTALDYAKNAPETPIDIPDVKIDKDECIMRISRALGK